jgi:hypothetical protein
MSVSYPPLPGVESGSESENGPTPRQNQEALKVKSKSRYESDEETDEESSKEIGKVNSSGDVDEISTLLEGLGLEPSKTSGKQDSKGPDKDKGKKSENEPIESSGDDGHLGSKKFGKQDSKEPGKDKGKNPENELIESSSDDGPEHTKAKKYTKEQREAITRVRKYRKDDYYHILDLEETCSDRKVTNAYRKLSMLTHPDKNKFKDATKAFLGEFICSF